MESSLNGFAVKEGVFSDIRMLLFILIGINFCSRHKAMEFRPASQGEKHPI